MNPNQLMSFKVIGTGVKMPTLSLGEVIKLSEGGLYDISFNLNLSGNEYNGQTIFDMPVESIIDVINKTEKERNDIEAIKNWVYSSKCLKKRIKSKKSSKKLRNDIKMLCVSMNVESMFYGRIS